MASKNKKQAKKWIVVYSLPFIPVYPASFKRVRFSLRLTPSRPQKAKGLPAEEAAKRYSGLQKPPADQLFGISALSGGLLRNIRNRLFPAAGRNANRPRQVSSPPATPSRISRFGNRMASPPGQFMPLNRNRAGTRFDPQPQSGCCFGLWRKFPFSLFFRPYVRKETFMCRARFPECLSFPGMKKPPEGGFYL